MPSREPIVVDPSVLAYHARTDAIDCITGRSDCRVVTTEIAYDPDETSYGSPIHPDEAALSEIPRMMNYFNIRRSDPRLTQSDRDTAIGDFDGLAHVAERYVSGDLEVIGLKDSEMVYYSKLASDNSAQKMGLRRAISPGAASCIAVAFGRTLPLASDDKDALKALTLLHPDHPVLRTQDLLIGAVDDGLISEGQANEIHADMVRRGFWDTSAPYPYN